MGFILQIYTYTRPPNLNTEEEYLKLNENPAHTKKIVELKYPTELNIVIRYKKSRTSKSSPF